MRTPPGESSPGRRTKKKRTIGSQGQHASTVLLGATGPGSGHGVLSSEVTHDHWEVVFARAGGTFCGQTIPIKGACDARTDLVPESLDSELAGAADVAARCEKRRASPEAVRLDPK